MTITRSFAPSADLAAPYVLAACGLAALSLGLLALELRRRRGGPGAPSWGIAATGAAAVIALLAAILRPVAVSSQGSLVGPKVVVLVDGSRSMDLPGAGGVTRREAAAKALEALSAREGVRVAAFRFGEGAPQPIEPGGAKGPRPMLRSDLGAALEAVARAADERPSAIVVISDGRLDRPGEAGAGAATRAALEGLEISRGGARGGAPISPVDTIAVATEAPPDAGVRAVRTAGAAVAHQPLSLRIDIGCTGGLDCDAVPVTARELREEGAPTTLATGTAHVVDGKGVVELGMTLDRAGTRILEVRIESPPGDTLPDNDTRYITVDVARDRIRVLHVAGRPTYDVRALRMWLKSDASVDVVAFFILRTPGDDVHASTGDLALIPFPVDELFSTHLPSFDAVVLQDFDAAPYGLSKHLPALADYVDKGGGLIMVGGPNAFVPGNYARTRLAKVLPVDLDIRGIGSPDATGVDLGAFVPRVTEAGRGAAVLAPLLALIGEELPEMPGTNVVGDALPGAAVLLTHPTLRTKGGAPMPLLALGEHGGGRTIALTLDGSHRLLFSAFASSSAGRAHGAFWDALLGWLMRDPRFEPAVIEPRGGCIAGEEGVLVLRPVAGQKGKATVTIRRLGSLDVVRTLRADLRDQGEPIELPAGALEPGGYSATVDIEPDDAAAVPAAPAAAAGSRTAARGLTTRRDFACERGGDEWADPRPDLDRLRAISAATGGAEVQAADIASLRLPEATQVAAERHVAPILPPWVWTMTAAAALGLHWIVRRRSGLS